MNRWEYADLVRRDNQEAITKTQGQSFAATFKKQADLRVALTALLQRFPDFVEERNKQRGFRAALKFHYIDINTGSGMNTDTKEYPVAGSPHTAMHCFIATNTRDFLMLGCDEKQKQVEELRQSFKETYSPRLCSKSTFYPMKNKLFLQKYIAKLESLSLPNREDMYGLLMADHNGLKHPYEEIYRVAELCPNLAIFINWAYGPSSRVHGHPNMWHLYPLATEVLTRSNRKSWNIGEVKHRYVSLLATKECFWNDATFSNLRTAEGQDRLLKIALHENSQYTVKDTNVFPIVREEIVAG